MVTPLSRTLLVLASLLLRPSVAHAQPSPSPSPSQPQQNATTPEAFAARFERIRATATPTQLYALLYDLPKGGDLHHHAGGAGWPEDWLAIATDPARNGGNTFYTRVSLAHLDVDAGEPPILFKTIQRSDHERLSEASRADYVALAELSAPDRERWLSSVRLDGRPGRGRDEFFELMWPRLGALSLAWPPNEGMQLDVAAVAGLNRDAPDLALIAGLARRF